MKTAITVKDLKSRLKVSISAVLVGTGVKFPNTSRNDQTLHNHYTVSAKTKYGNVSFDYYDSHADYEAGKIELNERDLIDALHCLLMDAMAGEMELNDFCKEFGYDDVEQGESVHDACVENSDKANSLFSDIESVRASIEALQEAA